MTVTASNSAIHGTATYTCNSGYAFESNEATTVTIKCNNDLTWDAVIEPCKETCGDPNPPSFYSGNLHYDYVDTGSTIFKGFKVRYECDTGYHYGINSIGFVIECIGVNYWSPFSATCVEGTSLLPNPTSCIWESSEICKD